MTPAGALGFLRSTPSSPLQPLPAPQRCSARGGSSRWARARPQRGCTSDGLSAVFDTSKHRLPSLADHDRSRAASCCRCRRGRSGARLPLCCPKCGPSARRRARAAAWIAPDVPRAHSGELGTPDQRERERGRTSAAARQKRWDGPFSLSGVCGTAVRDGGAAGGARVAAECARAENNSQAFTAASGAISRSRRGPQLWCPCTLLSPRSPPSLTHRKALANSFHNGLPRRAQPPPEGVRADRTAVARHRGTPRESNILEWHSVIKGRRTRRTTAATTTASSSSRRTTRTSRRAS